MKEYISPKQSFPRIFYNLSKLYETIRCSVKWSKSIRVKTQKIKSVNATYNSWQNSHSLILRLTDWRWWLWCRCGVISLLIPPFYPSLLLVSWVLEEQWRKLVRKIFWVILRFNPTLPALTCKTLSTFALIYLSLAGISLSK